MYHIEITEDIQKKIKSLRKEKKISTDEIGTYCGKKSARKWVYNIESGIIQKIDEVTLKKLAEILDVPVDDLMPKENERQEVNEKFEFYSPKYEPEKNATYREKYYYMLNENRILWKENAILKKSIIEKRIPYQPDNDNETV